MDEQGTEDSRTAAGNTRPDPDAAANPQRARRLPHEPGPLPPDFRSPEALDAAFRSLLRVSSIWYWATDEDLRFVAGVLDIAENDGKRPANVQNYTVWDIPYGDVSAASLEEYRACWSNRKAFQDFVYSRLSEDGQWRWVSISGEPIFDAQGRFKGYHGITRDITEQRQADQRQAIQTAVAQILSNADSVDDAMPRILESMCGIMGWDYGAWWLQDVRDNTFRSAASWYRDHLQDSDFVSLATTPRQPQGSAGLLARTTESRQPIWIRNVSQDPEMQRGPSALAAGLTGAFAFPVTHGDRVLGVVEFFARSIYPPDSAITTAAAAAGQQIGQFIVRKQAEDRYRQLVELSPDAIFVHCEGRIVFANSSAARIVRAPDPAAIMGLSIGEVLHPDYHDRIHERIRTAMRDKSVLPTIAVKGVRLDGTVCDVEFSSAYLEYDGKPAIQVIARDITGRKEAEQKILHLSNLYAALGRTNEAITRISSPQALFEEVCSIAVEFGRFCMAGIVLVNTENGLTIPVAAAGKKDLFLSLRLPIDGDSPESRGPTVTSIREGKPYICNDYAADPRTIPWRATMLASGFRSSVNFPLRRGGTVVGALVLYASETNFFDEELLELVHKISMDISFALDAMESDRQRAQAQTALEEKQRVLSTLMSNLPGMAYRCRNDGIGTMEFVSDGCFELTGYRAGDLMGNRALSFADLTHPEDHPRVWNEVEEATKARRRFVARYRIVTAQGDIRWVWEQGQGIHDAAGNLVAFEGIVQDVTAQLAAEKQLTDRKQQLQLALDSASQGLWDWNLSTNRAYQDKTTTAILGYPAEESEADADLWKACLHPDDANRVLESVQRHLDGETDAYQAEYRLIRKNGETIWVADHGRVFERTPDGKPLRMVGIMQDISERKKVEARLAFLAQYDVLTGLPNRTMFCERLSLAIARAKRNRKLVGLIFLDLDRFKQVNDTLGHAAGDRVLQAVSARLRENLREVDTLARLGGDEFTLIVEEVLQVAQLALVADKIKATLSAPFLVDGQEIFVNSSVGIAIYPNDADDVDELLKNADIAMYHAKYEGRDTHRFYSPDMAVRKVERFSLEGELRRALDRGEFVVHYQPTVDIQTNRIIGAEALVRWKSRNGMISPTDFIPIAEETGLIVDIGGWVLETACAQAAQWQTAGFPLRVAVNLSPRQFMQKDLLAMISRVLEETGLDARQLSLEITEGTTMHHVESVIDTLSQLNALGIRLAIDDFGTGYSSLAYLKRFPVHDIKIDKSFVRDIHEDHDDAAIVTAIVAMARSLGLRTIAEGVETRAQLQFLRSIGCRIYQGYLFSKPLPAEQFAQLLKPPYLKSP